VADLKFGHYIGTVKRIPHPFKLRRGFGMTCGGGWRWWLEGEMG